MNTINLQLTIEEVNQILESLGSEPFVKVYALIGKIQEQAQAQIGQNSAAQPFAPGRDRDE